MRIVGSLEILFIRFLGVLLVLLVLGCDRDLQGDPDPVVMSKLIAHQGYWLYGDCPKNSIEAFKKSYDKGLYAFELDVRQTKDGILVVCHDKNFFKRVISESNYKDLERHKLENGEKLPKLKDVFENFVSQNAKVRICLHVKSCKLDDLWNLIELCDVKDKVMIIGSLSTCLFFAKKGISEQCFSMDYISAEQCALKDLGGLCLQPSKYKWGTKDSLLALSRLPIVWTIDNEKTIRQFVESGCYVITNTPYVEK